VYTYMPLASCTLHRYCVSAYSFCGTKCQSFTKPWWQCWHHRVLKHRLSSFTSQLTQHSTLCHKGHIWHCMCSVFTES